MTAVAFPRIDDRAWHLDLAWRYAALAVVLTGIGLRFWNLGAHYLSYDETFTLLAARLSIPRLIAATAGDVHPPLSYLVAQLSVSLFGESAWALRLPSALMGSAAIGLVWALAERLKLSRGATLIALALFAFNPFEWHYSQDGRMYALLQLAVLGAIVAAWDRRWWALAACLTAAAWTHNYGLFYVAVIGALAFAREMGQPVAVMGPDGELVKVAQVGRCVTACALPVLLWLPWLAVLRGQMQTVSTGYWIAPLSLGQFLYPLYPLTWGIAMPERQAGIAALVGYGLVAFAIVKAFRLHQHRALVWLIVGPLGAAAVASLLWQPVYLFRAFIGIVGPLCLLIGWALTERASGKLTVWALALVAPLMLLALAARGPALATATGENARALATVEEFWQPGDVVVHGNVGSLSGFLATAPRDMPNYLMPVQPGSVGVLTPDTIRALGFCVTTLGSGQLVADCGADGPRAQSWQRAWLVWGASQTISGVEDAAVAELLDRFEHVKVLDIHDVYHGPMPVEGGIWLLRP